jgi:orotate phosphoribosyltransferase
MDFSQLDQKPVGYNIINDPEELAKVQDRYIQRLQEAGCLWYNPAPKKYCALLVSGKVSNGFINFRQIYETGAGLDLLRDMCGVFFAIYGDMFRDESRRPFMDKVSGTAYGALIPAFDLASRFHVGYGWTDKIEDPETGRSKGQVCKTDVKGKRILLVEDVLTTGGSVLQSWEAIEAAGGTPLPYLVCLINRSGKKDVGGIPVISLIEVFFDLYENNQDCPWIAQGAVPIKAKLEGNWEKLTTQK